MTERGKRVLMAILAVLLLMGAMPVTAKADIGQKSTLRIKVRGLNEETYYMALLAENHVDEEHQDWDAWEKLTDEGKRVWQKFVDYEDEDGLYFLRAEMDVCTGDHDYGWGQLYSHPDTFKVLLYFPENDRFIASEIGHTYAFDSCFTIWLDNGADTQEPLAIEETYDYTTRLLSLAYGIVATILVELPVAWFFHYRKRRQLLFIAAVNVTTQLLLNIALELATRSGGSFLAMLCYLPLELAVVIVEAVAYAVFLGKVSKETIDKKHAVHYAVAANVASFLVGIVVAELLPFFILLLN